MSTGFAKKEFLLQKKLAGEQRSSGSTPFDYAQ
jgi:hypothetical protein